MDHASSLDRVTPMTDKTNNSAKQSVPAALQLNTNLVRTLADTRRDSAVAIASAEAEFYTPSTRNNRPSVMPEAHENSELGPQESIDTQQQPGQDASMDPTTPKASDKEPKKTKKKKKKASKSLSGLCADQPHTSSPTVEDTSQPLPGIGATPTKPLLSSSEDQSRSAVVESNNQPLTEESLEWLESAVVRGDTKPTGKRSKAKKKSTAKKARDCHTSSTPSSTKGEVLSENEGEQQQEQEEQEDQTMQERTSADSSVPTPTISPSGTSSPSHDDSAVLTPKDDLAFLEDDLFGNGGSGNWADDVDEYVCQTTGSVASVTASNTTHSSLSSIAPPSSKDVPTIADSSTNAPQESSSTTAMTTNIAYE
ncbi:hypothetical protein BGZ72_008951 [Mortierella alpina]|nr:hypothetical protein BGZ72_008951 [Mortierella alpina]